MRKKTIIEVNNISKHYLVKSASIFSFQKRINVTALKKINFKIDEQDRVGIIGRNGSGKSTLCKIISGITYPTEGEVRISGKVSSVLEAGTGFEPELSGYENIFIGGAVLGMNRKSIKNRIKEIVNFSEIEEYIHMPLKKYSTGMTIKLAFALASFLDGNIFILDEVLAVADEKFRKKCIKKIISDCKNYNKTLILVSHDIKNIIDTCNKVIFLKKGEIVSFGDADKVVENYQRDET